MSLVYYCLDTETSGLKAGWHEITEISIIRATDRHQLSMFVRPSFPERANWESLEKTQRTMADLYKGEAKLKTILAIEKFLEEDGLTPAHRCIVAHNSSFDQRFCHALWEGENRRFPADNWLNSQAMARDFAKKKGMVKPKLTLGACLDMLEIKGIPGEHQAVVDAQNAYLLWKKAMDLGLDHLSAIKSCPHE